MPTEFPVCDACASQLETVATLEESERTDSRRCVGCGEAVRPRCQVVTKLELSDEVREEVDEGILACENEHCGKVWDNQDEEYVLDQTNSDLWSRFSEVVNGLPADPYHSLLREVAYNADGEAVDASFRCRGCGCEISDWLFEIKERVVRRLVPELPPLPSEIMSVTPTGPAHAIDYFRSDCSTYLVHLTRGAELAVEVDNVEEEPTVSNLSAPQVLWIILATRTLRAAMGSGMRDEAVCFTEKPLAALKDTLVGCESRVRGPLSLRWGAYGVMFEKAYLTALGVQPVLPIAPQDEQHIPAALQHFIVSNGARSNWLHEREWRSPGNLTFAVEQCIVLVPTFAQIAPFRDSLAERGLRPRGFLPLLDIFAAM